MCTYFCTFSKDGHHYNFDYIGNTNEVENWHLDVKSAFFGWFSIEEIYVAQPEGFGVQEIDDEVYKLQLVSFHPFSLVVYLACKLMSLPPLDKKRSTTFFKEIGSFLFLIGRGFSIYGVNSSIYFFFTHVNFLSYFFIICNIVTQYFKNMIFDYVLNSKNVSEKIDTHEDSIIGIQSDISKCVSSCNAPKILHPRYDKMYAWKEQEVISSINIFTKFFFGQRQ